MSKSSDLRALHLTADETGEVPLIVDENGAIAAAVFCSGGAVEKSTAAREVLSVLMKLEKQEGCH